jgi:hypothetical protein
MTTSLHMPPAPGDDWADGPFDNDEWPGRKPGVNITIWPVAPTTLRPRQTRRFLFPVVLFYLFLCCGLKRQRA